jgi:hypothetical protein
MNSPEVRAAFEALREVETLEAMPEFVSFMGRLKGVADSMADAVLHNDSLTGEEREAIRQQRKGVIEVLKLPAELKIGQERVLNMAGIKPGDILPEDQ